MEKQKKRINKLLIVKIVLTVLLTAGFLTGFFLLNGADLLMDRLGNVKCFAAQDFEVHYIDVGQGDCSFLRFPDGSNLLIDAGHTTHAQNVVDYLKDLFKQEGIKKIDRFLLTHQDSDHIGGGVKVLQNFEVACVYRPKMLSEYEVQKFGNDSGYPVSSSHYYDDCIKAVYNETGCQIVYSQANITWGEGYTVQFLSPEKDSYYLNNDYSPIVKVSYGGRSFLFTGDAGQTAEREVIKNCPDKLKADVLKVGHHGSKSSTSMQFLSYVKPEVAIISVGTNNSYSHPNEETLARLDEVGAKVYQTNLLGSIALTVDGGAIVMGGKSNMPAFNPIYILLIYICAEIVVCGIKPHRRAKR